MLYTSHIIHACIASGTPVALENPATSLLWEAPPIRRLLQSEFAQINVLDQCQFGAKWRKRTKVVCWHCIDTSSLCCLCSGRRGICSRTGKAHIVLSGSCNHSKKLWTSLAQESPKKLSDQIALLLVESAACGRTRVLQKIAANAK